MVERQDVKTEEAIQATQLLSIRVTQVTCKPKPNIMGSSF